MTAAIISTIQLVVRRALICEFCCFLENENCDRKIMIII